MPLSAGTYFVSVGIDMVMHSPDRMFEPLFYDLLITSEAPFVPEPTGAFPDDHRDWPLERGNAEEGRQNA